MTERSPQLIAAVVDDDQRVLESLDNLLESAGFAVRLFNSGIALLGSGSLEDIDCLISDIDLPMIDGFELTRRVLAVRPELPVFLITGHQELADRVPPSGSRPLRVFKKPFDADELLTAVVDAVGPARAAKQD